MTISQARRILGSHANDMTDEAVERLVAQFYSLAEVVADTVVRRGSKKTGKGIESHVEEAHNETRK